MNPILRPIKSNCPCSSFGADFTASGNFSIDSLINQGVNIGAQATVDAKSTAASVAGGLGAGAAAGTAAFPGIGTAVGAAVGAIVSAIPAITKALKGQCTITLYGQDSDCSDYPNNVNAAAKWIKDNLEQASHLDPQSFAQQTHILVQDFPDWFATIDPGYQGKIRDSGALDALMKLPGASTLLRMAQAPIAAALAGASPDLISLYRVTFPTNYPALTVDDLSKIFAKAQAAHDDMMAQVFAWSDAQAVKPNEAQIKLQWPKLLPIDIQAVIARPFTKGQQTNEDVARARNALLHGASGMTIGAPDPKALEAGLAAAGVTSGPAVNVQSLVDTMVVNPTALANFNTGLAYHAAIVTDMVPQIRALAESGNPNAMGVMNALGLTYNHPTSTASTVQVSKDGVDVAHLKWWRRALIKIHLMRKPKGAPGSTESSTVYGPAPVATYVAPPPPAVTSLPVTQSDTPSAPANLGPSATVTSGGHMTITLGPAPKVAPPPPQAPATSVTSQTTNPPATAIKTIFPVMHMTYNLGKK